MGVKISALPTLTAITGSDVIPFTDVDGNATSKITFDNFLASFITNSTWTPTVTFETPGDLAVNYSIRVGTYNKTGNLYTLFFSILTSSFTHSTANGLLQITGIPAASVAAGSTLYYTGSAAISGMTLADYTQFTPVILAGTSIINVVATAQGQNESSLGSGSVPSGATLLIRGSISYRSA